MQSSTRAALKLAPGATDADGAAALAHGGHKLGMRDLEKSDPAFLLYLKKERPATFAALYKDAYGKAPSAPKQGTPPPPQKAATTAAPRQPAAKPGAARLTMRELEMENPQELLRLKREEPAEYARLYAEQYGTRLASSQPAAPAAPAPSAPRLAGSRPAAPAAAPIRPISAPTVQALSQPTSFSLKQPLALRMTPVNDAEFQETLKEFDEAIRLAKQEN